MSRDIAPYAFATTFVIDTDRWFFHGGPQDGPAPAEGPLWVCEFLETAEGHAGWRDRITPGRVFSYRLRPPMALLDITGIDRAAREDPDMADAFSPVDPRLPEDLATGTASAQQVFAAWNGLPTGTDNLDYARRLRGLLETHDLGGLRDGRADDVFVTASERFLALQATHPPRLVAAHDAI